MKILKYIFTLFLLTTVCLSIFIATQKGDYTLKHSKKIEQNSRLIYSYITDIRSFQQWGADALISPTVSEQFIGKNAELTAQNFHSIIKDDNGKDRIIFEVNNYGEKTLHTLSISSLPNDETMIEMESKGNLSFLDRVKSVFYGGIYNLKGENFEKKLNNINFYVVQSVKSFDIEKQNNEYLSDFNYISKSFESKLDDFSEKIIQADKELKKSAQDLKLKYKEDVFVSFYKIGTEESSVYQVEVLLPIQGEAILAETTEKISTGKKSVFYAFKAKLTGDYSHFSSAKNYCVKEIEKIGGSINYDQMSLFKLVRSFSNDFQRDKWETIIYYPIKQIQNTETQSTTTTTATTSSNNATVEIKE